MTKEQVEDTLYTALKDIFKSDDELYLSGRVYIQGYRPEAATPDGFAEDVVLACLTGDGKDIMRGTCIVNIYSNDILTDDGVYLKDRLRCLAFAEFLDILPKRLTAATGLLLKRSGLIETHAEQKIRQHFVSLKMEFRSLDENY